MISAQLWETEWVQVTVSTELMLVSRFWRQVKPMCPSPGGGATAIVLLFSCSVVLGRAMAVLLI